MKPITREMIKEFKIKQYDMMGYTFKNKQDLSFHHLIVPHKDCKRLGLGEGYYKWNGAILVQNTSHNYLHIIENLDYEIFARITSEMIDENIKGRLDIYNLRQIRDLLTYFEKEYKNKTDKKGKKLIKKEYINTRILL